MKGKSWWNLLAILAFAGSLIPIGSTMSFGQRPLEIPSVPTHVKFSPEDFVDVTAGDRHTCVRKLNGNVYCWGANDIGQAGTWSNKTCGGIACVDRPEFVTNAAQIDAGIYHTCTLSSTGAASCWGNNSYGELGIGGIVGSLYSPEPVLGNVVFTTISAGMYSTCGTSASGVLCWGSFNNAWTPKSEFSWNGYSSVSVGYLHACALYVVGNWREVDCWGNNHFGQSGVDPALMTIVPATILSSLGVSAMRVTTQTDYTCADQTSGIVQCIGKNGSGQLGNGGYGSTHQAQNVGGGSGMLLRGVSTANNHACALDPTGLAYCWGNGNSGELGNSSAGVYSSPQAVAGGRSYRAIAAGGRHTCAIAADNKIYCWGNNAYGQLGMGNPGSWFSTPVQALDPR